MREVQRELSDRWGQANLRSKQSKQDRPTDLCELARSAGPTDRVGLAAQVHPGVVRGARAAAGCERRAAAAGWLAVVPTG